MTYLEVVLPFLLGSVVVTIAVLALMVLVRGGAGLRRYVRAMPLAVLGLFLLTAVFDNVMIAAGLFTYAPESLSGLSVGLAPLEDFAYPLVTGLLLPAIWELLRPEPQPPMSPQQDRVMGAGA